ncbi:hypothetical protein OG900_33630 [Streptomyces sp. NBC_00433]
MILEPADMHRALASHDAEPSPALIAVQELILAQDNLGIDPGDALNAARVLLAAHARELAKAVDGLAAPDCSDMSSLDDAWEHGNTDTAAELRRSADDLEAAAAGAA